MPLFAAYNVPVPEDKGIDHVVLPSTLQEIYDPCITAEVYNIAMYEAFLEQEDLPEDVKLVFQALKRASENHLQAFQRNADKPGNGQASRSGSRWAGNSDLDEGARNWNGRGRRGN